MRLGLSGIEFVLGKLLPYNAVRGGVAGWLLILLSVLACGAGWSETPTLGQLSVAVRWLVPLSIVGIVLVLVSLSPGLGLPLFAGMVPLIGLIRREMIPLIGYSGNDPITLVSAMVAAGLVVRLLVARRIRLDTVPSKLMAPMMLVMVGQIFNPAQGGLTVGVAGALYYIFPMLYFYIGRCHVNPGVLHRIFNVIVVLGIFCAGYGLYQHFVGFNARELAWMESAKYRQQMLGIYRVFSTFLSFGEYVMFIGMACLVAWTRLLRRQWIYAPVVVLLCTAIFLSSSRGGVIACMFAIVASWAVLSQNRRTWWIRGTVVGVVAVLGLVSALNGIEREATSERNSVLIGHQASGLTDPLGEESTGRLHVGLVLFGLQSGITRPAGRGLGSTTIASEKFGEQVDVSTEVDVTNFIVSTGIIGGVLYASLLLVLCSRLLRYWIETRSNVALSAVGMATVLLGNWTMGGYYAPSSLVWLMLGGVDISLFELERRRKAAEVQRATSRDGAGPADFAAVARG